MVFSRKIAQISLILWSLSFSFSSDVKAIPPNPKMLDAIRIQIAETSSKILDSKSPTTLSEDLQKLVRHWSALTVHAVSEREIVELAGTRLLVFKKILLSSQDLERKNKLNILKLFFSSDISNVNIEGEMPELIPALLKVAEETIRFGDNGITEEVVSRVMSLLKSDRNFHDHILQALEEQPPSNLKLRIAEIYASLHVLSEAQFKKFLGLANLDNQAYKKGDENPLLIAEACRRHKLRLSLYVLLLSYPWMDLPSENNIHTLAMRSPFFMEKFWVLSGLLERSRNSIYWAIEFTHNFSTLTYDTASLPMVLKLLNKILSSPELSEKDLAHVLSCIQILIGRHLENKSFIVPLVEVFLDHPSVTKDLTQKLYVEVTKNWHFTPDTDPAYLPRRGRLEGLFLERLKMHKIP
jgi:hypothetical protein